MLSKKLEDKIVDIVSRHLEREDGKADLNAVRKAVRHYVDNDDIAHAYLKKEKSDPGVLVHLTIDDIYYGAIRPNYVTLEERKKKVKKPKSKRKTKGCGCK